MKWGFRGVEVVAGCMRECLAKEGVAGKWGSCGQMGESLAKVGIVGSHFMVYPLYGVWIFIPLFLNVVVF